MISNTLTPARNVHPPWLRWIERQVILDAAGDNADVGHRRHAADEEKRGEHHADRDRNGQVDEHREAERREQDGDVASWRAQLAAKRAPFAHVVRHDDEDRGERRQRNQRRLATEEERDEQQRERVRHARRPAFGRRS